MDKLENTIVTLGFITVPMMKRRIIALEAEVDYWKRVAFTGYDKYSQLYFAEQGGLDRLSHDVTSLKG